MAGQLAAYGYKIVGKIDILVFWVVLLISRSLNSHLDDSEKADLWLLNSCTVKNPAEDHFK